MADTITDVTVPRNVWVSITALTSISVGQAMEIQNKGEVPVILFEGTSQPLSTYEDGPVLHSFPSTLSIVKALLGSGSVWVKVPAEAPLDGLLNVQEI